MTFHQEQVALSQGDYSGWNHESDGQLIDVEMPQRKRIDLAENLKQ